MLWSWKFRAGGIIALAMGEDADINGKGYPNLLFLSPSLCPRTSSSGSAVLQSVGSHTTEFLTVPLLRSPAQLLGGEGAWDFRLISESLTVRKCLPSSGAVYGVGSLVTKRQNPLQLAQEGICVVIKPISKKKKKKTIKNSEDMLEAFSLKSGSR